VKMFLAHWWAVAYRARFGTEPPMPWIVDPMAGGGELGHSHYIPAPVTQEKAS
jgi:hypothetical protein